MEDLTSTLSALAISPTKTPLQRCVEALIAEIAKSSPTQETARILIREITTTLTDAFCKEPVSPTLSISSTEPTIASPCKTEEGSSSLPVSEPAIVSPTLSIVPAEPTAASTLSIVPEAPPKKSRGGASLRKGVIYEDTIRTLLGCCTYNNGTINVREKTGGAGHGQDIQFTVTVNVECKDKGAFEGGGKTYKHIENKLVMSEDCLHKTLLEDYIPFGGRVPSFLKGDKTLTTWETEKTMFKDEFKNVSKTAIADYYKSKGIHYIQVEGKGLYTTGHDILELGVPLFTCVTKLRIRCKRHGSSTLPGSVQAALIYMKSSLISSPMDLQKILPSKFRPVRILNERL
jgi:hypothetical protein